MTEEIDYSGCDEAKLLHFLRLRDRQAKMTRDSWVRAAKEALAGKPAALRTKVDLCEIGPVTLTNGQDEWHLPG